ncbi:MAG: polysaccharide biosynthesis protein [Candidatus Acidiferrales bacterium]
MCLLRRSAWFIALLQACVVVFALVVAWLLRFNFAMPYRALLFSALPVLLVIRLAAIRSFGLLHGWWRYTGVNDILDVCKAVVIGSTVFFAVMNVILGVTTFPRSIYVLEAILTAGFLAAMRLFSRVLADSVRHDLRSSRKIVIVGAGFAAQMILREVRHYRADYLVVGCVDDDSSKLKLKIQGVPVMGKIDDLPRLLGKCPVDEILIAIPSATARQMQRIVAICEATNTKFRTVPALRELIAGHAAFHQLREVNLDDLLGRDPVEMDLDAVRNEIEGRTVIVTGAAGSIGSELCRQILEYQPRKIVCLDQSEAGVFHLQRGLSQSNAAVQVVVCIADVRDRERLLQIYSEHRPDVTFHAAAYKHVPVMESNISEAVKNNVFGLLNVLEAVEASGCAACVLISSDKAVNPTSVMGATKRAGELILSCRPSPGTRCVSVRFGNVLGSSGSVVPLLQEQLRNNQDLTVTHPRISRFFMTSHEAVSLVLQAFALGKHGHILVLDMKRPMRIVDLARSLIRLSGKSVGEVKIRFTGLRPGEKMFEELFYSTEEVTPTSCPKICNARGQMVGWERLEYLLEELRAAVASGCPAAVRAKLKEIVPEYSYHAPRAPALIHSLAPTELTQSRASASGSRSG